MEQGSVDGLTWWVQPCVYVTHEVSMPLAFIFFLVRGLLGGGGNI